MLEFQQCELNNVWTCFRKRDYNVGVQLIVMFTEGMFHRYRVYVWSIVMETRAVPSWQRVGRRLGRRGVCLRAEYNMTWMD